MDIGGYGSRIALAEPVIGRAFARPVGSLVRDDVNFASEFIDAFSTSKEGFKSSLRAKRSNPESCHSGARRSIEPGISRFPDAQLRI
jgi:hypothetical protein